MASETEVIKTQMEDTRASLADKLESLEQQVGSTVQGATDAVETVKEAVQNTVELVKESVQETVDTVKQTFDFPSHVRRYPWAMVGGAVAAGCVAGFLLSRATAPRRRRSETNGYAGSQSQALWAATRGHADHSEGNGKMPAWSPPAAAPSTESGFWRGLTEAVAPEVSKLKSLFIGSMLGLARDLVAKAAPEPIAAPLRETLNNITTRLGGEPLPQSFLQPSESHCK